MRPRACCPRWWPFVLGGRHDENVVSDRTALLLQPRECVVEVLLLACRPRGVDHAHAVVESAATEHLLEGLPDLPHPPGVAAVGPALAPCSDITHRAVWVQVRAAVHAAVEVGWPAAVDHLGEGEDKWGSVRMGG